MRPQDRAQREADAEQRTLREQRDAARKRAALRVLAEGGSVRDAATLVNADHRTIRRWLAESKGEATC